MNQRPAYRRPAQTPAPKGGRTVTAPPRNNRGMFDALNRLAQVEAEIERMEAEAQALRDKIKAYLEDAGQDTLSDEVTGVEAKLVTISRRTIDASKVPADILARLAENQLVTIKTAAAPVVPADAVTVTTFTQLRLKRV